MNPINPGTGPKEDVENAAPFDIPKIIDDVQSAIPFERSAGLKELGRLHGEDPDTFEKEIIKKAPQLVVMEALHLIEDDTDHARQESMLLAAMERADDPVIADLASEILLSSPELHPGLMTKFERAANGTSTKRALARAIVLGMPGPMPDSIRLYYADPRHFDEVATSVVVRRSFLDEFLYTPEEGSFDAFRPLLGSDDASLPERNRLRLEQLHRQAITEGRRTMLEEAIRNIDGERGARAVEREAETLMDLLSDLDGIHVEDIYEDREATLQELALHKRSGALSEEQWNRIVALSDSIAAQRTQGNTIDHHHFMMQLLQLSDKRFYREYMRISSDPTLDAATRLATMKRILIEAIFYAGRMDPESGITFGRFAFDRAAKKTKKIARGALSIARTVLKKSNIVGTTATIATAVMLAKAFTATDGEVSEEEDILEEEIDRHMSPELKDTIKASNKTPNDDGSISASIKGRNVNIALSSSGEIEVAVIAPSGKKYPANPTLDGIEHVDFSRVIEDITKNEDAFNEKHPDQVLRNILAGVDPNDNRIVSEDQRNRFTDLLTGFDDSNQKTIKALHDIGIKRETEAKPDFTRGAWVQEALLPFLNLHYGLKNITQEHISMIGKVWELKYPTWKRPPLITPLEASMELKAMEQIDQMGQAT